MQPKIFLEPLSSSLYIGTGSKYTTSASAFGLSAGRPHQCQSHFVFGYDTASTRVAKCLNTLLKDMKGRRTGGHGLFNSLSDSCSQDWN